jgi:hypothetical protein
MGKVVDIDGILLKNEEVIALGNMKVNARGDELGPGGKIIKTKDQVMKEYYALKSPVAVDPMDSIADNKPVARAAPAPKAAPVVVEPIVIDANSGIDDNDEGPAIIAVVDKPLEEVMAAPVVEIVQPAPVAAMTVPVAPPVQAPAPAPTFVPKEILPGIPAYKPAPIQADVLTDEILATLKPFVPAVTDTTMPPQPPETVIRGNLASAVAAATTVTQKELLLPKKANGVQRF